MRENASKNITYELDKESFRERLQGALKNVFIRDSKLSYKKLIFFIMTKTSAIQRDLDRFFKVIKDGDFNIREVTEGGFSRSRRKLTPWAFQRLNEVAVTGFYQNADYNIWGDYRGFGC